VYSVDVASRLDSFLRRTVNEAQGPSENWSPEGALLLPAYAVLLQTSIIAGALSRAVTKSRIYERSQWFCPYAAILRHRRDFVSRTEFKRSLLCNLRLNSCSRRTYITPIKRSTCLLKNAFTYSSRLRQDVPWDLEIIVHSWNIEIRFCSTGHIKQQLILVTSAWYFLFLTATKIVERRVLALIFPIFKTSAVILSNFTVIFMKLGSEEVTIFLGSSCSSLLPHFDDLPGERIWPIVNTIRYGNQKLLKRLDFVWDFASRTYYIRKTDMFAKSRLHNNLVVGDSWSCLITAHRMTVDNVTASVRQFSRPSRPLARRHNGDKETIATNDGQQDMQIASTVYASRSRLTNNGRWTMGHC